MKQYTYRTSNANRKAGHVLILLIVVLVCLQSSFGSEKKKKGQETPAAPAPIDASKLVWPPAPDIARIRYLTTLTGEEDFSPVVQKKKATWMDKMAGVSLPAQQSKPHMVKPYGIAADSKGQIYIADPGSAVIFVFNLEEKKVFYRGKQQVSSPVGMAIDDADRLFVSDSAQHVVLCFRPDGTLEAPIGGEKLIKPLGIALDLENRYLYVVDAAQNKVLVFDCDTYHLLREFGGRSDASLAPGTFDRPTNVAVNSEGDVFVVDTFNNRIQVFNADGQFVRLFGKQGNVAGTFMRPKGIAIDGDNHVYVVDSEFNNVQLFDAEGRVLMFFGGAGEGPGVFTLASGIAVDQQNRVIVGEQWKGKVQVFRYVSDAEARPLYEKRAAERAAAAEEEKKAQEAETLKLNGEVKRD